MHQQSEGEQPLLFKSQYSRYSGANLFYLGPVQERVWAPSGDIRAQLKGVTGWQSTTLSF